MAARNLPSKDRPHAVLIISGGIAAYKALDLIRRLRERDLKVTPILTRGAQAFVTPLAASALAGEPARTDLMDPTAESGVGHIALARAADIVVVAPATADLIAKMAHGLADDLATAVLLATRARLLIAPAMNPAMWAHPATERNLKTLMGDGIETIGPEVGEMAESGEAGRGRMSEPTAIAERALAVLSRAKDAGKGPLAGRHVLVTAGPTHEPIDPVRYIANRSSGKQGFAIAAAARELGARVTLVSGPVGLASPKGIETIRVETAREMLAAVEAALPADIGIFSAAVADWRVDKAGDEKLKKGKAGPPRLALTENPDILRSIAHDPLRRPRLVIGFAAETENVIEYARRKLAAKGADLIVANDVSPATGIMGGDRNLVHVVSAKGVETWPEMTKEAVARRLVEKAAELLATRPEIISV